MSEEVYQMLMAKVKSQMAKVSNIISPPRGENEAHPFNSPPKRGKLGRDLFLQKVMEWLIQPMR